MEPLEYIALAGALLKIAANARDAFLQIKASIEKNTEMTEEERAAWEAVMAEDYAKDYWQSND